NGMKSARCAKLLRLLLATTAVGGEAAVLVVAASPIYACGGEEAPGSNESGATSDSGTGADGRFDAPSQDARSSPGDASLPDGAVCWDASGPCDPGLECFFAVVGAVYPVLIYADTGTCTPIAWKQAGEQCGWREKFPATECIPPSTCEEVSLAAS